MREVRGRWQGSYSIYFLFLRRHQLFVMFSALPQASCVPLFASPGPNTASRPPMMCAVAVLDCVSSADRQQLAHLCQTLGSRAATPTGLGRRAGRRCRGLGLGAVCGLGPGRFAFWGRLRPALENLFI